uniref:shiftless antiviral inhibitor of ribosomal frameshifting protein homolog isoform X2 n=1 Tax=Pristiophorus japonicus TaxID=55135 RepID=UPI00398F8958
MARRELHEKIELEKSVRRFREMFQGNVCLDLAVLLMKRYHSNYQLVTKHIILMVTDHDSGGLDAEDRREIENDPVIQGAIETLRAEEKKAKNKGTKAAIKKDSDVQVSRCRRCKMKYDPVPADKTWGYAEFHCQECGNIFGGFGQMGLPAPCYVCCSRVTPTRILPPKKGLGPRTPRPHSCFAEDCYNRKEPHVPGTHCVHPRSRLRKGLKRVLYPSPEHDSTGSTIATCLSQGSLMECPVDDIIAEDILEEEEDEEEEEEDDNDTTEEDEDSTEKSDDGND